MKALVYPSDQTGCGLYRVKLAAEAARAEGVEIEYGSTGAPGEGMPVERTVIDGRNYVRPQPISEDIDAIVLQRVADETTVAIIPELQKAGFAVVVDMDDDMTCLPAQHPAYNRLNPNLSPGLNWRLMEKACHLADMVTVSTPALAERYGRHGRVAVLENCVPESTLQIEHAGDGNTFGWSGQTQTHPGDLAVVGSGAVELVRCGRRFLQVGEPNGVREQLGLDEEPESTGGIPNVEDYYRALARLDVGITPLADTRFNAAKSWLKPLEMTACGVAVVMSPREEYIRLHKQGIGLLAKDRKWRRKIEDLLSDPDERADLADFGRKMIANRHTFELNGWKWAEAWEAAVANRRGAAVAA